MRRRAQDARVGAFQARNSPPKRAFSKRPVIWRTLMLSWALIFFVIAIIAAVFGFGGIASASAGIAQILFFLFLVLFVVSLIMGLARRG